MARLTSGWLAIAAAIAYKGRRSPLAAKGYAAQGLPQRQPVAHAFRLFGFLSLRQSSGKGA